MSRLELSIAWRYLRSRSRSRLLSFMSMIAIGGVVVGVSALIVIIGVMNGLQKDLREKILIGSPDIRVLTYGDALRMEDWRPTLEKVKKQTGVTAAAPFVLLQAIATKGKGEFAQGVQVVGIEPEGRGVPDVTSIRQHATAGDFRFASSDGQKRGIVLGNKLALLLNLFPGDKITLISPAGAQMNALGGFIPQMRQYEVTGIFETGMYEYDNSYVYMSLEAAQEFAALGDGVTGIDVRTEDRWTAPRVAEALEGLLGFPFRTMDWQEQNRSLFQALKLEKLGMGIILGLIVIVAAFNIVSTLTMVVADKTREIGILKAMGMRASAIRRIFFAQGLVIGVVGTGLGVIVGLVAATALDKYKFIALDPQIYFIDHLPVTTEPLDVAVIILASVTIAALATIHPSAQAARLFPLDAIRHE